MKTITVTYLASGGAAQSEFAHLLEQYPDIALVPVTARPFEWSAGIALSRSDVAVIDEGIIQCDGDATLAMLRAGRPEPKLLLVMERFHESRMLWAITRGVRGVILRCELLRLLGKAIRQIHGGEVWMPRNLLTSFREMIRDEEVLALNRDSAATGGRLRLH